MHPSPPGAVPDPRLGPVVFPATPHPLAPPPGYGILCVDFNRGPYLVPAMATARFKISGQQQPTSLTAGRWYLAVRAGRHPVKVTDVFGFPVMTTDLDVQPGATHYLRFHFGGLRNRVHDAAGTDVTRFGMWSNYVIMAITLALLALVCCGLVVIVAA